MCFYDYSNVYESVGGLGSNLTFSAATLNQVVSLLSRAIDGRVSLAFSRCATTVVYLVESYSLLCP